VTANEGIDEKDFAIVGEDGNSVLNPTNQQMVSIFFSMLVQYLLLLLPKSLPC